MIGMAGPALFNELFSGAEGNDGRPLTAWFDSATATLVGRDVVDTVRELLGSVSRFDFQQVGRDLPQVDLPDLERFFTLRSADTAGVSSSMMTVWRSRRRTCGSRAATPYATVRGARVRPRPPWHERRIARAGCRPHAVRHRPRRSPHNLPVTVASLEGISAPVLVISVEDEVTGTGALVQRLIFGVTESANGPVPMRDWELLRLLNNATVKNPTIESNCSTTTMHYAAVVNRLKDAFESGLAHHAPSCSDLWLGRDAVHSARVNAVTREWWDAPPGSYTTRFRQGASLALR